MTLRDFLGKITNVKTFGTTDTVVIDIPSSLYLKHLAVYTAVGIIANAVSMCEIQCFRDGKEVKNEDYFALNVSPNINQTASQFWHKAIEEMLAEPLNAGEALLFELGGRLYCADGFGITEQRPIAGNVYENITVDGLGIAKTFRADEAYLLKMSNQSVIELINGMYDEYGKILSSAADKIKRSNGRKYKLHITGIKAGDEEFQQNFENVIKKQLTNYLENDSAVYPEFDGYDLRPEDNQQTSNPDDYTKIRKDMFDIVGAAYKIPSAMMTGNITNMKDIVDEFLTFAVDPIATMITQALNKRAGFAEWSKGNYYNVKTSGIYHRDIFALAPNIEKLIGSGYMDIDEVRKETGMTECNEPWSKEHWLTKNWAKAEELLQPAEGGEKE